MTPLPQEVIDRETYVQTIGDAVHTANASALHRDGFCMACGEVYVALQMLLGKLFPVEPRSES